MQRFKSAILAIFQSCQNGTFESMHEIRNFFLHKSILLKHYENSQLVRQIQDLFRKKVQKGDFLKKDSQELKIFLVLGSYEPAEGLEH